MRLKHVLVSAEKYESINISEVSKTNRLKFPGCMMIILLFAYFVKDIFIVQHLRKVSYESKLFYFEV